ncbi:MAG: SDR family oxidoreductase [Pseudonocardiaceae bacterium]
MRLLVAGMTGQLGTGLAAVAAVHDTSITCLVRKKSTGWLRFDRANPGYAAGAVAGDVTMPDWGLPAETIRRLAGSIDAVVNLAGETNWAGSSSSLYQVNVLGAKYGLELAERLAAEAGRPIRYCYASSIYTAGGMLGTVPEIPLPADEYRTRYEQSKWLAEQELAVHGVANTGGVLIARVAALLGDSVSGQTLRRDSLYLLAERWADIPFRVLPVMAGARVDVLPRDVAADALLRAVRGLLAQARADEPVTVHVALGERAPTLRGLLEMARSQYPNRFGKWIRVVPAPANLVFELSTNLERFVDLSPAWRNSVIGLRYIGVNRVHERGNLAALTGGSLPDVPVELLARLLFDLPERAADEPVVDAGLSRFIE